MTLRELMITLGFKIDSASERKVENTITSIKNKATTMLAGIGVALAIGEVIQLGDEFTNVNARLSLINDGLQTQDGLQKKVLRTANDTRQAYKATADFVSKLRLNNGKLFDSVGKALGLASTVNKALVIGGASTVEAESTILQLSQAMAAGRLQGDEFRSLAENAPVLMTMIAEGMGKTRGELKDMSKDGELTAEVIYEALSKTSGKIDQMFRRMPITFGQATVIVRNQWGSFISKINSDSGVLQTLAHNIVSLSTKITAFLDKTITKMGGINMLLRKTLLIVGAIWFTMNMDKVNALLSWARKMLIYAREELWLMRAMPVEYRKMIALNLKNAAVTIANVAAWLALFLIVEDFIAFLQGKDSVIGDILTKAGVDVEKVRKAFSGLTKGLSKMFQFFADHAEDIVTIGYTLLFVIGVLKILAIVMGVINAIAMASPITWIILAIIAVVILLAALVWVIVKNWGAISQWFINLWNGIKNTFLRFFRWIWTLLDNKWIQAALVTFAPFIGIPLLVIKNWKRIVGVFQSIWKAIEPIVKGVGDFFKGIFGGKNASLTVKHIGSTNASVSTIRNSQGTGGNKTNNVHQNVNINNSFHGSDREMQRSGAKMMTMSGNEIMAQNARALSYGR